jgi:acetolactate synthase I/II/III large subunit
MDGSSTTLRHGGKVLVNALQTHGVRRAFCVPGESYLPVLDALYDAREHIQLVVCRQEGGAAFMAEAYGKLTGEPGICFVTRGPGATNASIGVHTAMQDSTPMILFIGQVGSDVVEREAFQEVDFRRMFGQMSKWVAQIDRADRIPELLSHAFHVATSGRPGPVVLALPEDMLFGRCDVVSNAQTYRRTATFPGAPQVHQLRTLLQEAHQPFVILGGGGWNAQACADVQRFAETFDLPVGCAFRRQDLFDNRHANYAGDVGIGINPKLLQRIKDADLLITIGARLSEMTTQGYTLIDIPRPKQKFVHVHADANELGKVYQTDLAINASLPEFCAALKTLNAVAINWKAWRETARGDYAENAKLTSMPGALNMAQVVEFLRKRLPANAILTNGAGNFASWLHRFYPYTGFRTQLAPTNGAMGYGFPAAVAAKITHPDRPVVCFSGDGDYLMNGQELATAVQYGANVITLVINNGMYGTIRMHQEREYPARVWGTELRNPDFAALARAYGAHGETVSATQEFEPAFERALASGKPALIECRIDPEAITPKTTLSAIRAAAQRG